MSALVGSAIQLAISLCGIIGNAQAMKYVEELKQLQLDLITEEARGDDADDGKIEALHKQIPVVFQAIQEQYAITQKPPPPPLRAA